MKAWLILRIRDPRPCNQRTAINRTATQRRQRPTAFVMPQAQAAYGDYLECGMSRKHLDEHRLSIKHLAVAVPHLCLRGENAQVVRIACTAAVASRAVRSWSESLIQKPERGAKSKWQVKGAHPADCPLFCSLLPTLSHPIHRRSPTGLAKSQPRRPKHLEQPSFPNHALRRWLRPRQQSQYSSSCASCGYT
jgi:hypothetical protein